MRTLTLEIENESIADKLMWMLEHFKNEGVCIKEDFHSSIDVKSSLTQAVNEVNMVKKGDLIAETVDKLLNAL